MEGAEGKAKLRCRLSCHELPATVEAIRHYVSCPNLCGLSRICYGSFRFVGPKYQRLRQMKALMEEYKAYLEVQSMSPFFSAP